MRRKASDRSDQSRARGANTVSKNYSNINLMGAPDRYYSNSLRNQYRFKHCRVIDRCLFSMNFLFIKFKIVILFECSAENKKLKKKNSYLYDYKNIKKQPILVLSLIGVNI